MTNLDFRYEGIIDGTTGLPIQRGAVLKTALGTPQTVNVAQPLLDAARLAFDIEKEPVTRWKERLAAIEDEALRAKTRAMLEERWRKRQAMIRRETVGKKSSAGDAAMAELGKMMGKPR